MASESCKNESKPIVVSFKGISVSAFKNKKRAILDRHTGQMRTLTDAPAQKQMQAITRAIGSQLLSAIQTIAGETLTAQQVQLLTALCLPLDDSRQWLPELVISAIDCEKGQEGATIIIEQI